MGQASQLSLTIFQILFVPSKKQEVVEIIYDVLFPSYALIYMVRLKRTTN